MLAARKFRRGLGRLLFLFAFVVLTKGGITKAWADGWYKTTLNAIRVHTGPHLGDAVVGEVQSAGTTIDIMCQVRGDNVSWTSASGHVVNSDVWDRLSTPIGGMMSDIFATTPVVGDFSPGLPQCDATPPPSYSVRATPYVNVRAGADYASTKLGTIPYGSSLGIACQVTGRTVGQSAIWDQLASPYPGAYVSDWWVQGTPTGVFDSRLPQCGAPSMSTREAHAVSWAESQVGSTAWEWWCDRFVATAYGMTHSGYGSALAHWSNLGSRGLTHPGDWSAPAGALVFWSNGSFGHVAIAVGDGSVVSPNYTGVQRMNIRAVNGGNYYLGWSLANPEWPGR